MDEVVMDTEYGCLGGVTSAVRRLTVWKKFVLLSATDETRSDDPFNKLERFDRFCNSMKSFIIKVIIQGTEVSNFKKINLL